MHTTSKRDYEAIAAVIKNEIQKQQKMDNSGAVQALYDVAYGIGIHFQNQNSRFDDLRFMRACGAADQ